MLVVSDMLSVMVVELQSIWLVVNTIILMYVCVYTLILLSVGRLSKGCIWVDATGRYVF